MKFDTPAPEPQSPREKRSRAGRLTRWKWAFLLLLPAILFGPQLYDLACDYVAGLQLQRAGRELQAGDLERAARSIDRAIQWEPPAYQHWWACALRAEIREKMQNLAGAKDDCDEALKLLANDKNARLFPYPLAEVYMLRAWVKERAWIKDRLGDPRDALNDAKTAIDLCPADDQRVLPGMLNSRAYICALSGLELERGLSDIDRALTNRQDGDDSEMIDTRAYLLFKLGKAGEALTDMEKAIAPQEQALRMATAQFVGAGGNGRRSLRYLVDEVKHNLAVMYHHRGEIYEKLGKKDESQADLRRAQEFGYDPANGVM